GETEEVREPPGRGVDVDGRHLDVAALPEELLRAVAVMCVDVEHGYAVEAAPQSFGCQRRVVQVARATEGRAARVMAGRAAERVRMRRAGGDEIRGRQRGIDGAADRLPGARPDERHRVVGEEPGTRPLGDRL